MSQDLTRKMLIKRFVALYKKSCNKNPSIKFVSKMLIMDEKFVYECMYPKNEYSKLTNFLKKIDKIIKESKKKQCSKCCVLYFDTKKFFHKKKQGVKQYDNWCKKCRNLYRNKYYIYKEKTTGLTEKQELIYGYIKEYIIKNNVSPTIREVAIRFNISFQAVFCYVNILERKNFITKEKNQKRNIILL